MKQRTTFYGMVLLLAVAGVALSWTRSVQLDIPLLPDRQVPVWLIEARVDFLADGDEVLASLSVPDAPPGYRLIAEQSASPGYGFSMLTERGSRRGEWTIREASGRQTLYYKSQFIPTDSGNQRSTIPQIPPTPQKILWEEPESTAAAELLNSAKKRSSTDLSLARELLKQIKAPGSDQNANLLLSDMGTHQLMIRLLNQAEIPAREAMGLRLEDARRNQSLMPLVDVYASGQWYIFDPSTGEQGIPENTLLWHRGNGSVLDVMGGNNSSVRFSMIRQTVPALELAQTQFQEHGLSRFSFYQLPIEEQSMLKLLLLLPLGALVVAFMRIIIGVKTSGTFMPVLIALAFLQTSLVPGLIAFISIVSLGLLLRGYLSKLNLLLVARIATLIILVIFLTAMLTVLGHEMGFSVGMTITFFPMIIIAWTIERMSIIWEEQGSNEVMLQGAGSLLVATLAYGVMQMDLMEHLTFNFPEIHLVILALTLLTGQYTGYKLSELYRFREMSGDNT
ncbi:MAG: UUP1 family membrane protein [Oleiphilaceae bacterium]|nr:UUP1 family membrane protein [Oleiphilaceae bacterium]